MGIDILGDTFDGPFHLVEKQLSSPILKDKPGVYAIFGKNNGKGGCFTDENGNKWDLIDVGEADEVESCVGTHPHRDCWRKQGYETLHAAVFYEEDANKRASMVKKISNNRYIPCVKKPE